MSDDVAIESNAPNPAGGLPVEQDDVPALPLKGSAKQLALQAFAVLAQLPASVQQTLHEKWPIATHTSGVHRFLGRVSNPGGARLNTTAGKKSGGPRPEAVPGHDGWYLGREYYNRCCETADPHTFKPPHRDDAGCSGHQWSRVTKWYALCTEAAAAECLQSEARAAATVAAAAAEALGDAAGQAAAIAALAAADLEPDLDTHFTALKFANKKRYGELAGQTLYQRKDGLAIFVEPAARLYSEPPRKKSNSGERGKRAAPAQGVKSPRTKRRVLSGELPAALAPTAAGSASTGNAGRSASDPLPHVPQPAPAPPAQPGTGSLLPFQPPAALQLPTPLGLPLLVSHLQVVDPPQPAPLHLPDTALDSIQSPLQTNSFVRILEMFRHTPPLPEDDATSPTLSSFSFPAPGSPHTTGTVQVRPPGGDRFQASAAAMRWSPSPPQLPLPTAAAAAVLHPWPTGVSLATPWPEVLGLLASTTAPAAASCAMTSSTYSTSFQWPQLFPQQHCYLLEGQVGHQSPQITADATLVSAPLPDIHSLTAMIISGDCPAIESVLQSILRLHLRSQGDCDQQLTAWQAAELYGRSLPQLLLTPTKRLADKMGYYDPDIGEPEDDAAQLLMFQRMCALLPPDLLMHLLSGMANSKSKSVALHTAVRHSQARKHGMEFVSAILKHSNSLATALQTSQGCYGALQVAARSGDVKAAAAVVDHIMHLAAMARLPAVHVQRAIYSLDGYFQRASGTELLQEVVQPYGLKVLPPDDRKGRKHAAEVQAVSQSWLARFQPSLPVQPLASGGLDGVTVV